MDKREKERKKENAEILFLIKRKFRRTKKTEPSTKATKPPKSETRKWKKQTKNTILQHLEKTRSE